MLEIVTFPFRKKTLISKNINLVKIGRCFILEIKEIYIGQTVNAYAK